MRKKVLYTLFVIGLVMGVFVTWQFKATSILSGSHITDEVEARESLILELLEEQNYLQARIVALREQVDESQSTISNQTETVNTSILDRLKSEIGLTDVDGKGIQVILDDSPSSNRKSGDYEDAGLVVAADIRDVVNALMAGSAKAVSVNGQRIIATTAISSVGTNILINNIHTAPPFNIDAVGDTEILAQRILDRNALEELYEKSLKSRIVLEIYLKDSLVIPIYNGDLKTDYLSLIDEE